MEIILYMVIGWAIGELIHLTLWEWFKHKFNLTNRMVKGVLVFFLIAILILVVVNSFYRVTTYQDIILTTFTGHKTVERNAGIKFSFMSSRQPVDLQLQVIKFPSSLSTNGYQIITLDKKPVIVTSYLEFQITNVTKWGIENKDTWQKLNDILKTETIQAVQNTNYTYLKQNISNVQARIKHALNITSNAYGIHINRLNLLVLDSPEVQQAKSEAESSKIKAQALKQSYQSEAEAIKIKYSALKDKSFIEFQDFMRVLESGKINTILVPTDMPISLGGVVNAVPQNLT